MRRMESSARAGLLGGWSDGNLLQANLFLAGLSKVALKLGTGGTGRARFKRGQREEEVTCEP
jgi:hypothetical protein